MSAFLLGVVLPLTLVGLGFAHSWLFLAGFVVYAGILMTSETVRRLGRAGGVVPSSHCSGRTVVLGGGWSWILRRRRCPPNAIVCRRGRSRPGWWHAGTTIREVQDRLAREEGRTLAGHPSILSATLGGWIGSKSHGTGGSLWTPTMGGVLVEDVTSGTRYTLPSKARVDVQTMIVREVEIFSVPNVVCERRVHSLTSRGDVYEHLFERPTYLRAVYSASHGSRRRIKAYRGLSSRPCGCSLASLHARVADWIRIAGRAV